MTLNIQRRNGNGNATAPSRQVRTLDPFALARDLLRWDPFLEGGYAGVPKAEPRFAPSFEVKESGDTYVVTADLPGVKQEDVDLQLHGNILTISGSRRSEEQKEGESYYISERTYGSFARSFSLPEEADPDKIEAALADGVLRLVIPKRPEAKPRKIELKK